MQEESEPEWLKYRETPNDWTVSLLVFLVSIAVALIALVGVWNLVVQLGTPVETFEPLKLLVRFTH